MESDRAEGPSGVAVGAGRDDRIGSTIDGRYRLIELLGAGGMGRVYRGEHVHIRREVAVKLLHPRLSENAKIAERFEREAIAVGRLDHANCVYVQDFGRTDDGLLYLVMELARGTPLDHLISGQNPVPWQRALHIGRHVLAGLGHAHAAGIVHRDIKPENIVIVTRDGDDAFAKILDFGIAKLVGPAERDTDGRELTEAGMAFGTPTYMSPEQAYGQTVDGRADLYALSILLVELITGRPPFKADDKLAVLAMHTSRPVPALRELNPTVEVPAAVEEVLRRGLAKDPDQRFADAAAFASAMGAVLGIEPAPVTAGSNATVDVRAKTVAANHTAPSAVHAMPRTYDSAPVIYAATGATEELAGPGARRGWLLTAIAAVGGLVVLGVALSGSQSHRAETAAELRELGDPKAAVKFLEHAGEAVSGDAHAQLQLGHSYLATGRKGDALDAYEAAVELSPTLVADSSLRAALGELARGKNDALAVRAAALILRGGPDDAAEARLVDEAGSARALNVRTDARDAARALGLADRVDLVQSYGLDLRQGKTCEARSEAVSALRGLGDKRAIPMLEKARHRGGGSRFDRTNRNECLKQAAEEAIAHLRALPE